MAEKSFASTREHDVTLKVRGIVAEQLGVSEDDILPSSTFGEDLGADSLDVVECLMALEEEFEVEIPEEDAEQFETVKDLIDYVVTRMEY